MKTSIQKFWMIIAVLWSSISAISASAYDFEVNGIYYDIISASELTCSVVKGPNKYHDAIIIPNIVHFKDHNLSVVKIGEKAFMGCDELKTIKIGENVNEIAQYAFQDCTSLIDVILPIELKDLSAYCFSGCKSLSNISIPENISNIGDYAFYNCSSLISCVIPKSVTNFGKAVFRSCSSMTSCQIMCPLTHLPESTFYGCSSLKSFDIPHSVISIGNSKKFSKDSGAFQNCTSLENVTFGSNLKEIGSHTFYNCSKLNNIILPHNLELIYWECFSGCTSLESISIPPSVKTITGWIFSECVNLQECILEDSNDELDFMGFDGCIAPDSPLKKLHYGRHCRIVKWITNSNSSEKYLAHLNDEYLFAFNNLEFLSIGKNIEYLEHRLFFHTKGIKKLTIPKNVVTIGTECFANISLESLTIEPSDKPLELPYSESFSSNGYVRSVKRAAFENKVKNLYLGRDITLPILSCRNNDDNVCLGGPLFQITGSFYIGSNVSEFKQRITKEDDWGIHKVYYKLFDLTDTNKIICECPNPPNTEYSFPEAQYASTELIINQNYKSKYTDQKPFKDFWTIKTFSNYYGEILFDKDKIEIKPGENYKITCSTFFPPYVSPNIEWTSSNENIATVNSDGLVEVFSEGSCTITASTTDGSNISAKCVINASTSDIKDAHMNNNVLIDVYNLQGTSILKNASAKDISKLPAGLYIIHQGGNTFKIVVK